MSTRAAADVAADLVECGVKVKVSIPALARVFLTYLDMESLEADTCGFWVVIRNHLVLSDLNDLVREMYSFTNVTGQRVGSLNLGNTNSLRCFPGFEVFKSTLGLRMTCLSEHSTSLNSNKCRV